MLGIDVGSEEFKNFESMYVDIVKNFKPDSKQEEDVLNQIKVDVYRTFRPYNLKFLNANINTGSNKLYNLLKVYALFLDPSVGYT